MTVLRVLIASATCLLLLQGARAQSAPEELVKARAAFAAAVAANNEKAAADLSVFPLINRVYQEKPTLQRAEFGNLFGIYRQLGKCLKTDRLEPEKNSQDKSRGTWLVNCGGNFVLFGLRGGHWRHVGYENVNE